MERALKSFLDGISDDDNVVNLEKVVKKEDDKPKEAVFEQGTGSGMLDMRAMAQRYQEMSSSDIGKPAAKAAVEPPLPGQLVRPTLLAPVVEVDDSDEGRGWLIAVVALAVLVTIVSTAAITAVIVKRSVMAEIRNMGVVPQSPVTQDVTAAAAVAPETEQVAEWPAPDPTLVAGTGTDDEPTDSEMKFRESDVSAVERRRKREAEEKANEDPTLRPLTVPATTTTPEVKDPVEEPATTPEPTAEPQPKVAKDGEPCDEVLCLVEGRGCCGTAKRAPKAEEAVDTSLPERLERNDIKSGLATIDGRLNSCGVRFETTGVVTLKLSIGADGKVIQSSANKGSDEFQSCIGQTLKKARFAKTQEGGKLNYPVILR